MKINANFNQRAIVHSASEPWLDSPMVGVSRRPLDRVGSEVARATSIVRYAPGSKFSPHVHTGGEEFLVLEGVFQDEHGDYPAGSYIRNPPQTSHTPSSELGCVIFVKLWQFEPEDRREIQLDTNAMPTVPKSSQAGASEIPLFSDATENVSIQFWDAGQSIELKADNGIELLVLDGEFKEQTDTLVKHSWLRLPVATNATIKTGPVGAKVWIKKNHLARVNDEIQRVASTN